MQTHEWEALLSGTTPRPWVIGATLKDPLVDVSAGTYEDALLAAAPAAVAEVVRLRQAMTRLRDTYAAPDDPGDDYGRGMEAAYQIAADALTRILEGEA